MVRTSSELMIFNNSIVNRLRNLDDDVPFDIETCKLSNYLDIFLSMKRHIAEAGHHALGVDVYT